MSFRTLNGGASFRYSHGTVSGARRHLRHVVYAYISSKMCSLSSQLFKEQIPVGMLKRMVPKHNPVVPRNLCEPLYHKPGDGIKVTKEK